MANEPITRANRPNRKQVLIAEADAAALIKDGDVVIVGGFGTVNHPMPIIRALVRRKVKNLTVIGAATAGLEIDLLIGAGCVRKVIAPYIGAELHAPIGHCYRRAAENDEIEVKLSSSSERDDSDIAEDITRHMHSSTAIPKTVKAEVKNGNVTLRGEVTWAEVKQELGSCPAVH